MAPGKPLLHPAPPPPPRSGPLLHCGQGAHRGPNAAHPGLYRSTATRSRGHVGGLPTTTAELRLGQRPHGLQSLKHSLPGFFQSLPTLRYTLLQLLCPSVSAFPTSLGFPEPGTWGAWSLGSWRGPVGTWFPGCLLTPRSSQKSAEAGVSTQCGRQTPAPRSVCIDFSNPWLQPGSRMLRFSLITRGPGRVWKASDALSGPGFPPSDDRGDPRGPVGGGARGQLQGGLLPLAIRLGCVAGARPDRGQECASCRPRNGRNAASLGSLGWGAGPKALGSFQPAGTPHLPRKGPKRHLFTRGFTCQGRL